MSDYFYEVAKGHGLPHDPFKAIVAPRPIGWISSLGPGGERNLAPYSFFNGVCDAPPMVYFSTTGWRKDSVSNIEASGEFVVNVVGGKHAQAMNATAANVPRDVDEFALAGLEAAPCVLVKAPRVAGAVAAMECRLVQVVRLRNMDGAELEAWMTIGQVVGVHLDPAFLKDGIFDTAGARLLARCGYRGDYTEVSRLFEMIRPK